MVRRPPAGHLFHEATPTATLLTSLPFSSSVLGFSTSTVCGAARASLTGLTLRHVGQPTVVAPGGYARVVRHCPHDRWPIWFPDLVELSLPQCGQRTLAAPRECTNMVKQPPHTSSDISGGPDGLAAAVKASQLGQRTPAAPRRYWTRRLQPLQARWLCICQGRNHVRQGEMS